MRKAILLGKFIVTTTRQPLGAPFIDDCSGRTREGYSWSGKALHLSPWRRNEYGDRQAALALCIGVVNKNLPPVRDTHGRREMHCQCGQALWVSLKYLHGDGDCLKWYGVQLVGAEPHSGWLDNCPACGIAFGYPPPLKERVKRET